jgi:hypothetical protein
MKQHHSLTLFGIFTPALLACCAQPPPRWKEGSPVKTEAAAAYFQPGELDDDSGSDTHFRDWFTKHLAAAHEPSLRSSLASEAYRFTHLPSFNHPIVIRIQGETDGRLIVVKLLDGFGGYDPGNITVERYRSLTSVEWRETIHELARDQFWTRPKHGPLPDWDDGTVWVLEGKKGAEHKVVQWYTGDCAVCRHLGVLADVDLEEGIPDSRPPPVPPPPDIPW